MNAEKLLSRYDQAARVAFYGLVFFLPISIALSETCVGFAVFFFLYKKIHMYILEKEKVGRARWAVLKPAECVLNLPIAVFLCVCVISIVFISPYKYLSFRGFLGKELAWALVFFSFIESFKNEKQLGTLLACFLTSSVVNVASGYVQYLTGMDFIRGREIMGNEYIGLRITSSWKHSNNFAGYLLLMIPLWLSVFMMFSDRRIEGPYSQDKRIKCLWMLACLGVLVCFIGALGLTYSRGAWIGFLAALFFWMLIYGRLWVVSMTFIFGFLVIFLPKLVHIRQVSLVSDQTDVWGAFLHGVHLTAGGRFDLWREAGGLIIQHPFFGIGLNCYSKFATMYAHNSFLQIGAELGLIGLGVFLFILVRLFVLGLSALKRSENGYASILLIGTMTGLVGFLVQSFFDTHLYSSQLRELFSVFMGMAVVCAQLTKRVSYDGR